MTTRPELIAVCVAGGLVLSACGTTGSSTEPVASTAPVGAITIAGCQPSKPLIPSNTADSCGATILGDVVARLMTYDRTTGRANRDLAAAVTSRDAKKFTITLRAGAKYSDGTPVRAADFVKAWNFAAYGPNKQAGQYLFEPIAGFGKVAGPKARVKQLKGLKVRDARTFTVTLSRPASTFVQRLGMLAFAPLPPSFFTDNGAAFKRTPIGAGPYRVLSGSATSGWVLGANAGYGGPTPPSVDRITVKLYDDPFHAYEDVVANRIDLLDYVPGIPPEVYRSQLGNRVFRSPTPVMQTLIFPSPKADRSYANPKLRRALAMAVDRDAVIRAVFGGERIKATGWAPRGAYGADSKGCGSACAYDPKQARSLFKAAGGHTGPIRIAYNADATHQAWVSATCRSIAKTLSVTCKPAAVRDFATFRSKVEARKQAGILRAGWLADYPSIENFLGSLYATGGEGNDGDYSSAKFDALLTRAAATPDLAKANALYRKAERVLRADMPAIPLWYPYAIGARSNAVASASFTVFGTYDLTSIVLA